MRSRLTDAHRSMQPGESVLCSTKEECQCVRAHWRGRGGQTVQKQEDGAVRVWRLK
jgi:anti-sigma factor ChrR (cupin superfamily)